MKYELINDFFYCSLYLEFDEDEDEILADIGVDEPEFTDGFFCMNDVSGAYKDSIDDIELTRIIFKNNSSIKIEVPYKEFIKIFKDFTKNLIIKKIERWN